MTETETQTQTRTPSLAPSRQLYKAVARYGQPNLSIAIRQILNTLLPYAALWVLMLYTVREGYAYWITLALAVVAAGLLVRVFILFHDAGHGSFFASRRANRVLGYVTGILTFTPFEQWRHSHAIHHATVGDLDRRGVGDVWTMTVAEYRAAPRWKRWGYRIYRNPLVMFGLGPAFIFLITQRFFQKGDRKQERFSVVFTNLAIVAILALASVTIGLRAYVSIQLPVILMAGSAGVWLFYVQHQFEGVYWARREDWEPLRAALEGSSYYRLPRILQWFTGSIGLHHVHHVQARVPNYHLQRCYDDLPDLQEVTPLTLLESLRCVRLNLWDEEAGRLVSFGDLKH